MSLPLSEVLEQLKSAPESVIPILASLHQITPSLSAYSKVDLKHLANRTLNLCRSNDTYSVWCGVNILHVLVDSSEIVGQEGSVIFAQLLKVLGSSHTQNRKLLDSGLECLRKLCDNIRGKPTLTREVLTPNLSSVFTVLLEKLSASPLLALTSLKKLIMEHPTTSRPFANKLKNHILSFINEDNFLSYPQKLRTEACSTLACLPVIEKEAPEQHWLRDVNAIISETTNTAEIYTNFLNVKDDQEVSTLLKALSGPEEGSIFPPLDVDINHPSTIFAISQRITMLLELLEGYIISGTKFTVVVPMGKIIALFDLVSSLNTRFISFKREVRDAETKEYVEISLTRCHAAALALLRKLPVKYSASLVPHISSIFATLESLVFLQNKRLDHARILANESMVCDIITCTTNFLGVTSFYSDHASISRIVEAAVFLMQPRTGGQSSANSVGSENVKVSHQSKSARKKTKRNAAVPLSDVISHEHLFKQTVPESSRRAVLAFFTVVIRKVPISSTHYNKILKHVIIEAVKHSDSAKYHSIPEDIENVLIASSLHPAPESASIFPIASRILPSSDILGVLNSPRFPPLSKLVRSQQDEDEEEEEEDEEEEVKSNEVDKKRVISTEHELASPPKKLKADSNASEKEGKIGSSVKQDSEKVPDSSIFTAKPMKSLQENEDDIAEVKAVNHVLNEEEKQENNEAFEKVSEAVDEEMESDDGSEIEIPDLDLEDDSEDES